jgi:hypothetical protein
MCSFLDGVHSLRLDGKTGAVGHDLYDAKDRVGLVLLGNFGTSTFAAPRPGGPSDFLKFTHGSRTPGGNSSEGLHADRLVRWTYFLCPKV